MIELLLLVGLSYYLIRYKPSLESRLHELVEMSDPQIAEKLNIVSTTQVVDLMKSLKYIPDTGDSTQTPEETVQIGGGDCEDLSVLSYSLLDYLGLNPGIAIAYSPDDPEAHAFTFFYCESCGEYYIFSNNEVFKTDSIEEASSMLGYDYVIYTPTNNKNREVSIWVI